MECVTLNNINRIPYKLLFIRALRYTTASYGLVAGFFPGIAIILLTGAYKINNLFFLTIACFVIMFLSICMMFFIKLIPILFGQPTLSIDDSNIILKMDRFLLSPLAASIYSPRGRDYTALYFCLIYHQYGEIPLKSLKKVYVKKCLKKYYEVMVESTDKISLIITNTRDEAEQFADLIKTKITSKKSINNHNLKSITEDDLKIMKKNRMTPLDWLTVSCAVLIFLLNQVEIQADLRRVLAIIIFLSLFLFSFLFREIIAWIYWHVQNKDV